MNFFKHKNRIVLCCLFLFFIAQGCVTKKETVELFPEIKEHIACSDMLLIETTSIPYDDFALVLDTSCSSIEFEGCWKPLMKKALKEGRPIPMKHLAKAVNVFNRNDSKDAFSLAVYMYFKGILNGSGAYRDNEKMLLAEYLSFTITNARSKQDGSLEKAKLVCSRLDPVLYGKIFR